MGRIISFLGLLRKGWVPQHTVTADGSIIPSNFPFSYGTEKYFFLMTSTTKKKKNHFPSPHLKIFWKFYFFVFSTEVTGLIMASVQTLPPQITQDRFFHEAILHGLLSNQYNSINAAPVEACTRPCLGYVPHYCFIPEAIEGHRAERENKCYIYKQDQVKTCTKQAWRMHLSEKVQLPPPSSVQ